MMTEPIQELNSICESIFLGKTITEAEDDKKEEDSSDTPFADEKESDSSDKSDDSDNTETTEDTESTSETNESDDETFGSQENDDESTDEDDGNDIDVTGDETAAGEIANEDYADASDFGIELMMLGVQVHFWHINCGTNGEHETLQTLYYGLEDAADKILENVISQTNQSITAGSELSFDFGDLNFNKEECIGILEDIRAEADNLGSKYGDNQGLCNILGDISEKLSTAIYKLSRFESNETL